MNPDSFGTLDRYLSEFYFHDIENGSLTRVYYSDERPQLRVTEDVGNLENDCREQMEQYGWI
jgi:hypothetical protein